MSEVPCKHPPKTVLADICEGDAAWRFGGPEYEVQWCQLCGAYRRNNCGEWSHSALLIFRKERGDEQLQTEVRRQFDYAAREERGDDE